ncbi:Aspyridones efflux protein [Sparassis crispa]|uniref:Aspyridones efflux protein n=1 Tax=Sparassis crispa TaxID=139825 RepID=A0A401GT84_9APHY|nr:Aspyridones efflux protein [Sparassis crispa]GBE85448.1 Aspyridones efflux protein [Sparassis crispa]
MADLEKKLTLENTDYCSSPADKTSRPDDHVHETALPDGGLKGWLTVLGAFLALLCGFGQLNSFGTFQSWYAEHQLWDKPASTISWIGTLQLWIFFFSGSFLGRVFDAYGPRILTITGTVVLVVSIMLTSLCTQYYQYMLAQGILFGLGVGMLFYPSLSAISTHFTKRRASAIGLAMAGSGIGGVMYPIILRRLFAEVGFPWAVRISGFISLALCLVAITTVTSRLPAGRDSGPWINASMFRDVPYVLVVVSGALISLGLFIPYFYIVDYAMAHSIPATTAFYVLSVMNAGSVLGRIAPSYLSDMFGRYNLIVPCSFLAGLLPLVYWIFATTLPAIMIFAAIYGFFSGAFNSLIIPCVAQISKTGEHGRRVGMLYSVISFPALCGGPAAGALLRLQHGSYSGTIVLSGVTMLVGSFFMLWARLTIDPRLSARV